MPIRDVLWQGFSLSYGSPHPNVAPEWMMMTYNVWHQDAHQLLHNLLANPEFDGEFDYVPFCEYNA